MGNSGLVFYLWGGVLQGYGQEGKRRRASNPRSIWNKGRPVAIEDSFLNTLDHSQEALKRTLPHTCLIQPRRESDQYKYKFISMSKTCHHVSNSFIITIINDKDIDYNYCELLNIS